MSFDSSSDFLVGVPTAETSNYLREMSSPQIIPLNTSPIAFLSAPREKADTVQLPDTDVPFTVIGHLFSYNPVDKKPEFSMVLEVSLEFQTMFSDLDIDLTSFVPYARLAVDPMRTKASRFWCNSIGNALKGKILTFNVTTSDSPILKEQFNPMLFDQFYNHPH